MKRLHPGFNVEGDCIVTKSFPMRAEDPPGIFLGRDSVGKPVYITYWTGLEIAMMLGYPPLEVVEELKNDVDRLNLELVELESTLGSLVENHIEQKYIKLLEQTKDEILEEQKRTTRSLRDASKFATDPDTSRTAKLGGREGSETGARSKDPGNATGKSAKPTNNAVV